MFTKINSQKGFTLVELLMIMGVFAVLSGIVTVNLLRPQIKASVDKTTNALVADIKLQQIKAMVGDDQNVGNPDSYGIYFGSTSYTLFKGSTYNSLDTNNIEIALDGASEFSNINLPSAQIVFERLSGEVSNYNASQDDLTISHNQGVVSTEIIINKYGTIEIN